MRNTVVRICACVFPLLGTSPIAYSSDTLPSLAPVLEAASRAVVNISTRSRAPDQSGAMLSDPFFRHFFDAPDTPQGHATKSLGSGVIVDAEQGFIVTNYRVVSNADVIEVTLNDRRKLLAKLIGSDRQVDVAVLKIEADELVAMPFSDSSHLRVGDYIMSLGNPYGIGVSATHGVVSAVGRSGLGVEKFEDFIQTDAIVHPGNSGGALIGLDGALLGINTSLVSVEGGNVGIGLAIPSDLTKDVVMQLVEFGEINRAWLGLHLRSINTALTARFDLRVRNGAVVVYVDKGSAAAKSGVKPGDVVCAIDGASISDINTMQQVLRRSTGTRVVLEFDRVGKRKKVTLDFPEPGKVSGTAVHEKLAGTTLVNTTEATLSDSRIQGVEVLTVDPDSNAWQAGLRAGDIIVGVNREAVINLEDSIRAAHIRRDSMLLHIRRASQNTFVLIR